MTPDILCPFLFIFLLHPFPLGHNVFNAHLTGNLLFNFFRFGHHQADLAVILLGQNIVELRFIGLDLPVHLCRGQNNGGRTGLVGLCHSLFCNGHFHLTVLLCTVHFLRGKFSCPVTLHCLHDQICRGRSCFFLFLRQFGNRFQSSGSIFKKDFLCIRIDFPAGGFFLDLRFHAGRGIRLIKGFLSLRLLCGYRILHLLRLLRRFPGIQHFFHAFC